MERWFFLKFMSRFWETLGLEDKRGKMEDTRLEDFRQMKQDERNKN